MTANHDQSAICKILIGGKREAKESKTITKKFVAYEKDSFDMRTTPLAQLRRALVVR
jgi:hypothetical protein